MRRCQHSACRAISRSTSAMPSPQFYFDSAASVSRSRRSTCVTLSPANAKAAGESGPILEPVSVEKRLGGCTVGGIDRRVQANPRNLLWSTTPAKPAEEPAPGEGTDGGAPSQQGGGRQAARAERPRPPARMLNLGN